MKRSRPTRTDLLRVLSHLQTLVGAAKNYHQNDRDPVGFEKGQNLLENAFNLMIEAQGYDEPVQLSGSQNGWNFPDQIDIS